jgi:predicted flap endonuclease-1-like 5' DNA nuclease
MDFIREYWWLILVVVIAAAIALMLLRPKQSVRLSDSSPIRPHMADARPGEGRGVAGEAAAATSDVAGQMIGAQVRRELDGRSDAADDFSRMKGVGPKFADALHAIGFVRYEQLAALTPAEIERLDPRLGAFSGRIIRDRVVEQAQYLARGDTDGFEQRFGKL